MKKAILTTSIILACCLSACSTKQATAPSESPVITTEVNTEATPSETDIQEAKFQIFDKDKDYSDLGYDMTRNQPYALYLYGKNGWYYGTSWNKNGNASVQKIRDDGTDQVFLTNTPSIAYKIREYEGYIYTIMFANDNDDEVKGLYRSLDSGDDFQLLISRVTNFQIYNNEIYYEYVNENDETEFWKCDLNGENSERVIDEPSWYNYVYDNKVIYQGDNIDVDNGEHIKIMNLDSGEILTLTNRHSWWPILDGENLFYLGTEERGGTEHLYKLNLSTMKETCLKDNVNGPLQYVDEFLYFHNGDDSNRLYRIDTNGFNCHLVLQNENAENIQVKTDGVYYLVPKAENSSAKFYYADINGGNKTDLSDKSSWWRG